MLNMYEPEEKVILLEIIETKAKLEMLMNKLHTLQLNNLDEWILK